MNPSNLLGFLLIASLLAACDGGADGVPASPSGAPDGAAADGGAPDGAAGGAGDASPDAPDAAVPADTAEPADAAAQDAAEIATPPFDHRARALGAAVTGAWLMEHVTALASDGMEGRDNLTAGGAAARAYLVAELTALAVEPAGTSGFEQAFPFGVNVVGRIPGVIEDQVVLVGAHYDHLGAVSPTSHCAPNGTSDLVCNGATDNATGCAAVLGVARGLRDMGGKPLYTVLLVLFDAEEDGLLGSSWMVDVPEVAPLDHIVAVVNLDTVGSTIIPGVGSTFVLGIEHVDGVGDALRDTALAAGLVAYPVSSFFDGSQDGERSDHFPFRMAGRPALFFSSGAPPEYHSPADEPGIVDVDKLERTVRHALLFTAELAWGAASPTPREVARPHIGDAVALASLGDVVLADPAAVGVTDPLQVTFLETITVRLHAYVDDPPVTDAEWVEYEEFIRGVIDTVFEVLGR